MALIAVDAVVNVVAHTLVMAVSGRLQMAVGTREDFVVIRVDMARGANTVGLPVSHREIRMIERRAQPGGRAVAGGASFGESRRHVIGIGGRSVFFGVAGIAVGGRARELSAHMARRTQRRRMLSGKRKAGIGMIEGRRSPGRRRMAQRAIGGISRRRMRRCLRIRIVGQVAIHTRRPQAREFAIHVASGAGYCRVLSGERKLGGAVIERRRCPSRSRMAQRAILRESRHHVIRIRGLLKHRQVTIHACCAQSSEYIIDVA